MTGGHFEECHSITPYNYSILISKGGLIVGKLSTQNIVIVSQAQYMIT